MTFLDIKQIEDFSQVWQLAVVILLIYCSIKKNKNLGTSRNVCHYGLAIFKKRTMSHSIKAIYIYSIDAIYI